MRRSYPEFIVDAEPPSATRAAAARAVLDTIGVTLAGSVEPAAAIVRRVVPCGGPCTIIGATTRAAAPDAALVNGTAAHALDYDDMCFVSLAHPSAPLVPAALAAAELSRQSGRALLDAYVVGFEIEARLGRAMNPRHYERGWHCTSTLGTIGAAAAAARLLGVDADTTGRAIAIAASQASGLKENFGTMVKPLHAGLAARNGVLAALLSREGLTASAVALTGRQGFLHAFDSERDAEAFETLTADLGSRWEILDTGVTTKLYPSCAATHPTLDALLALRRDHAFTADDVTAVHVGVDPITPTVLLYDAPSTGLEAKFSMPFCAAAAIVDGRVDVETFDDTRLRASDIEAVRTRVTMQVDASLDTSAPPLTQARVTVRLRDGRTLQTSAHGARGYPQRPASDDELAAKFLACARRAMGKEDADRALDLLRGIEGVADVSAAAALLGRALASTP